MPRALNPANLATGGGLAAQRSVEANSFVNPTQGLEGLGAHIVDPSQAHMAAAIGIVDAGGYYTSDEVEGALQEIAASQGYTYQNGVYQNCGYTAVGLDITFEALSFVIVNGTGRDISGGVIALTNNATNWIYVHGTTGVLSKQTGASPPSITSPENLLLWRIVTSGGAITASRDARWFVRNLNRKMPLTIRSSGTEADANSEAAFESIDAALLYLENFASGVMRTYTMVLKGPMSVPSTLVIPVDGVTLQGEDGCVLSTGANNLAPVINISGRSNIKIQDITFSCDHTGCNAISVTSSGVLSGVWIERCTFVSGSQDWNVGVDLNLAGPQSDVFIRDCSIESDTYGIRIREPNGCRIENVTITEQGTTGTEALSLGRASGAINTTTDVIVSGCTTVGYGTGCFMRGAQMSIHETKISDCDVGVVVDEDSTFITITDSLVVMSTTTGVSGITIDADQVTVSNCKIANPRAGGTYTAEIPVGVDVATGSAQVIVSDCVIIGFWNTTTPGGVGIRFAGGSGSDNCLVQSTLADSCQTGIEVQASSNRFKVSACTLNNVGTGAILHDGAIVIGTQIQNDSVRGLIGFDVIGDDTLIEGCTVTNPRVAGSYGALDVPMAVRLNNTGPNRIHNLRASGFRNSVGSLGAIVGTDGGAVNTIITGVVGNTAEIGFDLAGASSSTISDCVLFGVGTGIVLDGGTNLVTGTTVEISTTFGVTGIATAAPTTISDCLLVCNRVAWTGQTPIAVDITGANVIVSGCQINGWHNTGGSLGAGVYCGSGAGKVLVNGNSFFECWIGLYAPTGSAADIITVSDNEFSTCDLGSIYIQNSEQVRVSGNTISTMPSGSVLGISVSNGTDVEVIGNRVNGNSETQLGIHLAGTDTVANRLRRFVVSDNDIRAIAEAGIKLEGYVQNGVVSGNHVDGNLAAGDPSATCILLEGSTTALPKYIEISSNTCWRGVSGIVVQGVSLVNQVTDVSVIGNTIHHCALGSGTTTPCYGVSILWTTNSIVANNAITQIGQLISNTDVVSNPTAGANVYPTGISLDSVTSASVMGNTITDCVCVGTGVSQGIQIVATGASDVVTTEGASILNNHVRTSTGITPHTYGILVSYGQTIAPGDTSTLTGLVISGNTIQLADQSGISLVSSGGSSWSNVSVKENTITDTVGGISALVQTSGVYTPGILQDFQISSNHLLDIGASGILITTQDACQLANTDIQNNVIRNTTTYGVRLVAGAAPDLLANINVTNNQILGSSLDAVSISITDYAETEGINVSGNTILGDTGGATGSGGVDIRTVLSGLTSCDLLGLRIEDNHIQCTDQGVYLSVEGLLRDAVVANNAFLSGDEGLFITLDLTPGAQAYSENLSITGNTFSDGEGCWVYVQGGQKLKGLLITDNIFRSSSYGSVLSVEGATVGADEALANVHVANNMYMDVTNVPVGFLLGMSGAIDTMSNIHIIENQFFDCNSSGLSNVCLYVSANGLVRNLTAQGNHFKNCGTLDSDSGVSEFSLGTNAGTLAVENVSYVGNSHDSCSGPAFVISGNASAAAWTLSNLRVDNNTIEKNTFTAIHINLALFTSARGVSVCGNMIDTVSGASSDTGIWVETPSANTVDQVVVSRNTIRSTGGGATGGIFLDVQDDVDNLMIDGNSLHTTLATDAAIQVSVAGLWTQGSISNNLIRNSSSTGIHVEALASTLGTTGIESVSISNNEIWDTTGSGIYVYGAFATTTPILHSLQVANNVLDTIGGTGILVEAFTGTGLDSLSILGNNIKSTTGSGISITPTGSVVVTNVNITGNSIRDVGASGIHYLGSLSMTGNLIGLIASNNTLYDLENHGIFISTIAADIENLVVGNNQVRSWSKVAGTTSYSALQLISIDASNVAITGNTAFTDQSYAIGYSFRPTGLVRVFNVTGNNAYFTAANTESMRFDTSVSTDQEALSITSNNFRDATTGVNFNASSFAPDYSVCSLNVERTSGGAGNWAAFVAPFTNSITTSNQS